MIVRICVCICTCLYSWICKCNCVYLNEIVFCVCVCEFIWVYGVWKSRIVHSLSNSKLNCYNLRWLYVHLRMYNVCGVACLCVFKCSGCSIICDDYMIGWQGREFQVYLWQSVLREIWASWGVWISGSAYCSRYSLISFLGSNTSIRSSYTLIMHVVLLSLLDLKILF